MTVCVVKTAWQQFCDPYSCYITHSSPGASETPLGVEQLVSGDYEQTSPPASNDWHYVSIMKQTGSKNSFTWKNRAGVEWELIFIEEESDEVLKFQVI